MPPPVIGTFAFWDGRTLTEPLKIGNAVSFDSQRLGRAFRSSRPIKRISLQATRGSRALLHRLHDTSTTGSGRQPLRGSGAVTRVGSRAVTRVGSRYAGTRHVSTEHPHKEERPLWRRWFLLARILRGSRASRGAHRARRAPARQSGP